MKVAGWSVERSYRFGLRLGLNLVVALVVLCVLFVAREPGAEAGAIAGDGEGVAVGFGVNAAAGLSSESELQILHPRDGEHLSGETHIKLKVGQSITNVAISIDGRYLASGPPYNILWNSSTVSNGPHRITIAAVTPALVSDAPVRLSPGKSRKFYVHNSSTPTPTPDPTATPTPASTPSPNPTPTLTPPPTATPTSTPDPTPLPTSSPIPTPAATPTPTPPSPTPTPTPAATPSPKPSPTPTPISVSSLTLVDADTAQPIPQFNPLVSGATINLATLSSHNLTIQANTAPATVGSVVFDLVDSGYLNTVNTAPYDLCGSAPCPNLDVGLHSLTTTPYFGSGASGGAGKGMSISFSVIDPTPTPTLTPAPTPSPTPAPTTLTTTLKLTSANNGQTFSNYRISTTSGPCVTVNGAANITITRSNIGPCGGPEGATTNADSNGIELIQGSRTSNIQIVDNYIHTDTFPGNPCTQQQHTGIMDQSITSGTANLFQGNVIAYGGKGIHVNNGGVGDQSIGNFIINQREDDDISPCEQGNAIESDVPGTLVNQNYGVECTVGAGGVGTGQTDCSSIPGLLVTPAYSQHMEDIFASGGSSTNPATMSANYAIGGRSSSATCYLVNDANTSTNITNNRGINCGGNGAATLGLSGGVGTASGNLIFSNTNTNIRSAAGVAAFNWSGSSPYAWILSNNKIDMLTSDGYHNGLYCGSYCSALTLSNNYIGSTPSIPFPTLSTTSTVAQIEAVLGAPPLIPPVPKNCVIDSPFTTQTAKPAC